MIETEVGIVGAGPAGLAAGTVLARAGVGVTLLDENPRPGGQYFRQPPAEFARVGSSRYDSEPAVAARLFALLEHPLVRWLPAATVWDVPDDGVLAYAAGAASGRLQAQALLFATGAGDRAVPFPGWTLPGVLSAGGCQNLIKGQRVLPGRRVVVAGNGPLLLAVATNLLAAGAEVEAVVEAAPIGRNLRTALGGLACSPALLALGLRYRAWLHARGVPLLEAHVVTSAQGCGAIQSVTVAPLGADGRPGRERSRVIACDTLVTGFGLAPATELAQLAGCTMTWDAPMQARVPRRSVSLESSRDGVWVAGDNANLGGAALAMAEGEVAAHAMLGRLRPATRRGSRAAARALARLQRLRAFRDGLSRLHASAADWLSLVTPETLVCRCESVSLASLRPALADSDASLAGIKAMTRCGLGRCQGRNCLASLAALLARTRATTVTELDWPRPRPPARPVEIAHLLHEPLPAPELPADPHLPRNRR